MAECVVNRDGKDKGMTFEHKGRTYTVDRIYSFRGEIIVECHFCDNGQEIDRTWRLADLELPWWEEESR